MPSKIKIKITSLLAPVRECIPWVLSLSSCPSLPLTLWPSLPLLKTSLLKTSLLKPEHVFHIDIETSSRKSKASSTSWKAKATSRKSESSTRMLLWLRVNLPSLIINPSFFLILEKLIGIDYLLELLLSPWIFFIPIRVILLGSLLEGLPDLLVIGILLYSKHFIGVGYLFALDFFHH